MGFALDLFRRNELAEKKKIDNFLEYFEDEDTRNVAITEAVAGNIIESAEIHCKDKGRIMLDPTLAQRVTLTFVKSDFVDDYNLPKVVSAVIEQIFRVQSETNDSFDDKTLINAFYTFFESKYCEGAVSFIEDYASQIIERSSCNHYDKKSALSTEELDFTTLDYIYKFDDGEEEDPQ